jgi:hypothetical protein
MLASLLLGGENGEKFNVFSRHLEIRTKSKY